MRKNTNEDFMAKRLSAQSAAAIDAAKECALSLGHRYLGTEHLLAGMMRIYDSKAAKLLRRFGVDEARVVNGIKDTIGVGGYDGELIGYTPRIKAVFDEATDIAAEGTGIIDTENLLSAILLDKDSLGTAILRRMDINVGLVLVELSKGGKLAKSEEKQRSGPDTPLLNKVGRDMIAMAVRGEIDPCIGREEELLRMMRVLCRRSKNNPCLVGEPGVGKTAIVEGLATRIARGNVPPCLQGKKIVSLDMASVVAGSKYRGEFEDKIKKILEEVKAAENVILFIDEVHTILGAGGAEGAIDASNIMKPVMARGEVRIIGATTYEEYKKTIEKDGALDRRFQQIQVREPSISETVGILRGLRSNYEQYHGLTITDGAINAAAELSARYIQGRFLPDKAIDLMDESAAKVCIDERNVVTAEDVAEMCSNATGIPVGKMSADQVHRLLEMEQNLSRRVVGQEEAVAKVCACIRRGRAGIKAEGRPSSVFLFVGPTGVGKTELAKALAAEIGDEKNLIRIDMSEYTEKHSVSKLIGSPPGYVGHENGGMLIDKIRRNPYGVVLFDEVEKSGAEIRNLLLTIMDEGRLTDSQGREADFTNTIIIMTANGTNKSCGSIGFGGTGTVDLTRGTTFSKEFLARIDEVIYFKEPDLGTLCTIAGMKLGELKKRLCKMNCHVEFAQDLPSRIASESMSRHQGARPVAEVVRTMVENPLADMILSGADTSETIYFGGENQQNALSESDNCVVLG